MPTVTSPESRCGPWRATTAVVPTKALLRPPVAGFRKPTGRSLIFSSLFTNQGRPGELLDVISRSSPGFVAYRGSSGRLKTLQTSKNLEEMLVLLKTLPLECGISVSDCFSILVLVGGVTPDYGDK